MKLIKMPIKYEHSKPQREGQIKPRLVDSAIYWLFGSHMSQWDSCYRQVPMLPIAQIDYLYGLSPMDWFIDVMLERWQYELDNPPRIAKG